MRASLWWNNPIASFLLKPRFLNTVRGGVSASLMGIIYTTWMHVNCFRTPLVSVSLYLSSLFPPWLLVLWVVFLRVLYGSPFTSFGRLSHTNVLGGMRNFHSFDFSVMCWPPSLAPPGHGVSLWYNLDSK